MNDHIRDAAPRRTQAVFRGAESATGCNLQAHRPGFLLFSGITRQLLRRAIMGLHGPNDSSGWASMHPTCESSLENAIHLALLAVGRRTQSNIE